MIEITPLERAAKAAYKSIYPSSTWSMATPYARRLMISAMRAGLLAIREPSEGMVEAGDAVIDAELVWQAMIDEAVRE